MQLLSKSLFLPTNLMIKFPKSNAKILVFPSKLTLASTTCLQRTLLIESFTPFSAQSTTTTLLPLTFKDRLLKNWLPLWKDTLTTPHPKSLTLQTLRLVTKDWTVTKPQIVSKSATCTSRPITTEETPSPSILKSFAPPCFFVFYICLRVSSSVLLI